MLDLCLMVKNEEKYIRRCIESVKDYVGNIYILDTGSTDRTLEIVARYTTKIYYKEFNGNFAEMRQELLNKAKAEWILFLDGDEYFESQDIERLCAILDNVPEDVGGIKLNRYNFFSNGGWYNDHIIKVYRNYKGFRYDKQVTEKIETSIRAKGYKIIEPDIILNHTGHCKSRTSRDEKTKMYLELLKKQLQKTPEDALLHSYIGINSKNIGEMDIAYSETKIGVEMNPKGIVNHIFLGNVLRALNKPEEALNEYEIAFELSDRKDFNILNLIGVTYLSMNRIEKAKDKFKLAYQKNEVLIHCLLNYGLAEFYDDNYGQALQCFTRVIERDKAFLYTERDIILNTNYCDCLSYETISGYMGLEAYIAICKSKICEEAKNGE